MGKESSSHRAKVITRGGPKEFAEYSSKRYTHAFPEPFNAQQLKRSKYKWNHGPNTVPVQVMGWDPDLP